MFAVSACLVVSCADKKPEATPTPKLPPGGEQTTATKLPAVPQDNLDLANQLRDPGGMSHLEAANGASDTSAPVKVVNAPATVEIPRPTNPVPAPPLPQVNLPE